MILSQELEQSSVLTESECSLKVFMSSRETKEVTAIEPSELPVQTSSPTFVKQLIKCSWRPGFDQRSSSRPPRRHTRKARSRETVQINWLEMATRSCVLSACTRCLGPRTKGVTVFTISISPWAEPNTNWPCGRAQALVTSRSVSFPIVDHSPSTFFHRVPS